jgi:anti-sigma-K factor RskA
VTEGRSYLRTTAADSTAGKVSDKTKDRTDMMKLMTDMQKRLSDLQRNVNQLKNEQFRPRKFDNKPRFNYGRGQAYEQNYGRGHWYRQNFGRGQDNRQNGVCLIFCFIIYLASSTVCCSCT